MPQILRFLPTHKSQEDGANPTSSFPTTGARGRLGVVFGVWVKVRVSYRWVRFRDRVRVRVETGFSLGARDRVSLVSVGSRS